MRDLRLGNRALRRRADGGHRAVLAPLALALIVAAPIASAWNWADDNSEITQYAEFDASKAVCRRLDRLEPPVADRPDADAASSLAGCESEALYYGIGMPRRYERARACAFDETSREDEGLPFGGIAMLMMIYANGVGVARELDLATALACRLEDAPAAVDSRVRHLQRLKHTHWQGRDFDYCDDITSGLSSGFCAARDARIDDTQRNARLDVRMQSWPARDRQAFADLRKAEDSYAQASADNEVDLSGTARAALMIDHAQALHEAFVAMLDRLRGTGLAGVTAADFGQVDARLNRVYQDIMAIRTPPDERGYYGSEDSLPWITVTRSGIRDTQHVWLDYREAWVDFAAVHYPRLEPDALRAALTRQRIAQLTPFLPESSPSGQPQ